MSGWFDLNLSTLQEQLKNSVDQATKLVEDLNLDNMQVLQELEENDPELAAANAAKRKQDRLLAEQEAAKARENETFFAASSVWDDPLFSGVEFGDDAENEVTVEDEVVEGAESGMDHDDARDTNNQDSGSVFYSLISDVVKPADLLPDMPTISFSLNSKVPDQPIIEADNATLNTTEKSTDQISSMETSFQSATGASRISVTANPNRFWPFLTNPSSTTVSSHPITSKPQFFDNDDDVDLESDPIMQQVKLNKSNPNSSISSKNKNSMQDILNNIMKPFQQMAKQREEQKQQTSIIEEKLSKKDDDSLTDRIASNINREEQINLYVIAGSASRSILSMVHLIAAKVMYITLNFVVPGIFSILLFLWTLIRRLYTSCSNQRGEDATIRGRMNNFGWCLWSHMSSNNGLAVLVGLLLCFSYWKFLNFGVD